MTSRGSSMSSKIRRMILFISLSSALTVAISALRLPGGVHFAAPHQGSANSVRRRLDINPRWSAKVIAKILNFTIPIVHAQDPCSTPACDGTKPVPRGDVPYCTYDYTKTPPQPVCAVYQCSLVGGTRLCADYSLSCQLAGRPTLQCDSATSKDCH